LDVSGLGVGLAESSVSLRAPKGTPDLPTAVRRCSGSLCDSPLR